MRWNKSQSSVEIIQPAFCFIWHSAGVIGRVLRAWIPKKAQIWCVWDNTTEHKWTGRFLECADDFLLQLIEEMMSFCHGPLPHQQGGAVGNVQLKRSIVCRDHEILWSCERLDFKFLRAVQRVCSKLPALDFRGADFGLFRDLFCRAHGIKPCREDQPKKTGWYSRIYLELRSKAAQRRGRQAKIPRELCGWTRSSWTNSNTKMKSAEGVNEDR